MEKIQTGSNSPLSWIMPFLATMILPPLCLESFTSLWDSTYSLNNWNPSSASLLWLKCSFFCSFPELPIGFSAKWSYLTEPLVVLDDSQLSHSSSWRCSSPWQGHRESPTLNCLLIQYTGWRIWWRWRCSQKLCSQNHSLTHICPQTIIH